MSEKPRFFGLDCVRVLGMVLLLWLHFYMRNYYYYRRADSVSGVIATAFVPFFLSCVPLFMVITGYLKCEKEWNMRYYASLLPILVSWLLCSALHLIYKLVFLKESKTALEWLVALFNYQLADYSWYVGMYISVFFFAPLLNLIWKSCSGKKQHRAVLLTLAMLTVIPAVVNRCGLNLMPQYLNELIWPMYYLIGAYIRSYQPRLKPLPALLIMAPICLGLSLANILTRTKPDNYYTGFSIQYSSLCLMVLVVCVFLLSYRLECENIRVRRAVGCVSGVVFEMYLLSYFFDSHIFIIGRGTYPFEQYPWRGLWMTAAVFALSFLLAWPVHFLSTRLSSCLLRWIDPGKPLKGASAK